MFERTEFLERLTDLLEALERIPIRFGSIHTPDDFLNSESGREHLDSICMILMASGEAFKQIDNRTGGKLLLRYPEIPWRDIIGVRNVIAHGYFDIDEEQVFNICKADIPELITVVRKMISDSQKDNAL